MGNYLPKKEKNEIIRGNKLHKDDQKPEINFLLLFETNNDLVFLKISNTTDWRIQVPGISKRNFRRSRKTHWGKMAKIVEFYYHFF